MLLPKFINPDLHSVDLVIQVIHFVTAFPQPSTAQDFTSYLNNGGVFTDKQKNHSKGLQPYPSEEGMSSAAEENKKGQVNALSLPKNLCVSAVQMRIYFGGGTTPIVSRILA